MLSHSIVETVLETKKATKSRFRKAIIEAWGSRCAYCGAQPQPITLDHIVPKCRGGHTTRANLVPACIRCNLDKNHRDWLEWFRETEWHCPEREQLIQAWRGTLLS